MITINTGNSLSLFTEEDMGIFRAHNSAGKMICHSLVNLAPSVIADGVTALSWQRMRAAGVLPADRLSFLPK
jgi:hypothetical protein